MKSLSWPNNKPLIVCCYILAVGFKLWLVAVQPLRVDYTPHDDLLFINQASYILQGNWLGEFSHLTLIKGSFYPLFIAFANLLEIPLLTAQHLLYALACFVFVKAIQPIVKSQIWLFVIFMFLLFNPFTYNFDGNGRVFRLSVYPALVIFYFSSLSAILIGYATSSKRNIALWATCLGLSFSALWITREEGIWLIPPLLIYFLFLLVKTYFQPDTRIRLMIVACPLVVIFLTVVGSIKWLNHTYYGEFISNELKSAEFTHAYGALLRVESDDWLRFYPFRKDSREAIYKVSPAFAELRDDIEGDMGKSWQMEFPDINGGLFMWLLRDAIYKQGYYKDLPTALAYYQRLGDEITVACENGQLRCANLIHGLMPPWHPDYAEFILPEFIKISADIIKFRRFSPYLAYYNRVYDHGWLYPLYKYVANERIWVSNTPEEHQIPEFYRNKATFKLDILDKIGNGFYRKVPQVLFFLGLVIFVFFIFKSLKSRNASDNLLINIILLTGLFSHLAIITIINVTSYESHIRLGYTDYPLVLMFCVMSMGMAPQLIRRKALQKRDATL